MPRRSAVDERPGRAPSRRDDPLRGPTRPDPSTAPTASVAVPVQGGVPTWSGTLDGLERDVARLEEMARRPDHDPADPLTDGWTPPVGLGPVPDDLRERAVLLLQRQLDAAQAIGEQITQSRRQREVVSRMSQNHVRSVAVFVDRTA